MRIAVFLLLAGLLTACGNQKKVPDGIIPTDRMTDILWDVLVADELVNQRLPVDTGTRRFDTSILLYQQIADKHKTSQQAFKNSLAYYEKRPDLFQVIIDSLSNRANAPLALPAKKDTLPPK